MNKNKVLAPTAIIPESLYVWRDADRQIAQVIGEMGRPGYILVARQMGKTNLLINAKRTLSGDSDLFAYVDLSKSFVDERECFRYITDVAIDSLPPRNSLAQRVANARAATPLPPYKEYENEMRMLLGEISGKVVIILDEIDSLMHATFSDRIFAQVRSAYFARVNITDFERLTYILSGVVDPNDLIKDKRISPFNIGQKIFLDDFNRREFDTFIAKSRVSASSDCVDRIFHWTRGNPRMTWDIVSALEDAMIRGAVASEFTVDGLIQSIYFSDYSTAPVDHIRQLVTESIELRNAVRQMNSGEGSDITEELKNRLYLAGIISSSALGANAQIKNPIIATALSNEWIDQIAVNRKGLLRAADEAFTDQDFRKAHELYTQFIRGSHPAKDIENHCVAQLAFCSYQLGDYEAAVQYYERCSFDKVDEPKMYYTARAIDGICHFQTKRFEISYLRFQEVFLAHRTDETYFRAALNLAAATIQRDGPASHSEALKIFSTVIKECDESIQIALETRTHLKCLAYYNLGVGGLADSTEEVLLKALELARPTDRCSIHLALVESDSTNNPRQHLIDAVNEIVSLSVRPAAAHPEHPLSLTRDRCIRLLSRLYALDQERFDQLLEHVMRHPEPIARTEVSLLHEIAISSLPFAKRSKTLEILYRADSLIHQEPEKELEVIRLVCVISDEHVTDSWLDRYYALVSKVSVITRLDFRVFERAIAMLVRSNQFEKALDWISFLKENSSIAESGTELLFAAIYFWELRIYVLLKLAKRARSVASDVIRFLEAKRSAVTDASPLDLQQLNNIYDFALSVVRANIESSVAHSRGEPGRNTLVSFRYWSDDQSRPMKYKHAMQEVIKGKGEIVQ